ncbi:MULTISPECIES: hypothetical protein [unclassified Streptomyces]|nr:MULTISPECIES: hypothetical protein [unclassified Streptomyces]
MPYAMSVPLEADVKRRRQRALYLLDRPVRPRPPRHLTTRSR